MIQPPGSQARGDRLLGDPLESTGGPALPRWPLLAALLCVFLVVIGMVLWFTMPCFAILDLSRLCRADVLPDPVQAGLVWLLFGVLWLLSWAFGAGIQEPRPARSERSALLRTLSDFAALRPAIITFGVLGLLLSAVLIARGRAQGVVVAAALLPAFVAVWTIGYEPPGSAAARSAQDRLVEAAIRRDSPLFRLRSLPPLRYVWPNRPPRAPEPDTEEVEP